MSLTFYWRYTQFHSITVSMEFSQQDIRKLIYYCWRRDLTTADIFKEINTTLGKGTVSLRTCSKWIAQFRCGDVSTEDQAREGRPSMDLCQQIDC